MQINVAAKKVDGYKPTAWACDNGDGTINVHVIMRNDSFTALNVPIKQLQVSENNKGDDGDEKSNCTCR